MQHCDNYNESVRFVYALDSNITLHVIDEIPPEWFQTKQGTIIPNQNQFLGIFFGGS